MSHPLDRSIQHRYLIRADPRNFWRLLSRRSFVASSVIVCLCTKRVLQSDKKKSHERKGQLDDAATRCSSPLEFAFPALVHQYPVFVWIMAYQALIWIDAVHKCNFNTIDTKILLISRVNEPRVRRDDGPVFIHN